jgi:hypothetical protein
MACGSAMTLPKIKASSIADYCRLRLTMALLLESLSFAQHVTKGSTELFPVASAWKGHVPINAKQSILADKSQEQRAVQHSREAIGLAVAALGSCSALEKAAAAPLAEDHG